MNENLIFQNAPEHYLFCYNDECELADNCLHRLVAQYGNTTEKIVHAVNPKLSCGKNCRYHRPKKVVTVAYGMLHSYDKVLAADIVSIRKAIIAHFGNGSYYARRNGKKPITPNEQQYISKIFHSHGYPDGAVFDRYVDELEW